MATAGSIPISRSPPGSGNKADLAWFIAYCAILAVDSILLNMPLFVCRGSVLASPTSFGPHHWGGPLTSNSSVSISLPEGFSDVLLHLCTETWECQRIKAPPRDNSDVLHPKALQGSSVGLISTHLQWQICLMTRLLLTAFLPYPTFPVPYPCFLAPPLKCTICP